MARVDLSLENLFQLRVKVNVPSEHFAFYLYRESEVVEKRHYTRSNEFTFFLKRPGVYRVKGYWRDSDGVTSSSFTQTVTFAGLVPTPRAPESQQVALVGVSTISAFAMKVFEKKHKIAGFVDPSGLHVGGRFFGYPILSDRPSQARLIGHENYAQDIPAMEVFDLRVGNWNVLSKELNQHGAMPMYRISRDCYLNGLQEGANYLSNTILRRYNSRVPHTAVIGRGTSLGVGGMGIAIHHDSIIGKECIIGQNVTLGIRSGFNARPIIGDNVFIAPGAKCLGGRIGNNSIVGANAVVIDEVPDNCVVAGVPAKIISRDTSDKRGYTHRRQGMTD